MSGGPDNGRLRPGSLLWVQDERGEAFAVPVLEVDEGAIVVDPGDAPLGPSRPVVLEHCVSGDARYRATADVEVDAVGRVVLLPRQGWQRDNQRAYVRVRTYGIAVRMSQALRELLGSDDDSSDDRFAMLDLSAGGASFRAVPRFEVGDEVVCDFELPGEDCFVLPARVVRVDAPGEGRVFGNVAIEFVDLDESHRSALLRWVYREQTRRRRDP